MAKPRVTFDESGQLVVPTAEQVAAYRRRYQRHSLRRDLGRQLSDSGAPIITRDLLDSLLDTAEHAVRWPIDRDFVRRYVNAELGAPLAGRRLGLIVDLLRALGCRAAYRSSAGERSHSRYFVLAQVRTVLLGPAWRSFANIFTWFDVCEPTCSFRVLVLDGTYIEGLREVLESSSFLPAPDYLVGVVARLRVPDPLHDFVLTEPDVLRHALARRPNRRRLENVMRLRDSALDGIVEPVSTHAATATGQAPSRRPGVIATVSQAAPRFSLPSDDVAPVSPGEESPRVRHEPSRAKVRTRRLPVARKLGRLLHVLVGLPRNDCSQHIGDLIGRELGGAVNPSALEGLWMPREPDLCTGILPEFERALLLALAHPALLLSPPHSNRVGGVVHRVDRFAHPDMAPLLRVTIAPVIGSDEGTVWLWITAARCHDLARRLTGGSSIMLVEPAWLVGLYCQIPAPLDNTQAAFTDLSLLEVTPEQAASNAMRWHEIQRDYIASMFGAHEIGVASTAPATNTNGGPPNSLETSHAPFETSAAAPPETTARPAHGTPATFQQILDRLAVRARDEERIDGNDLVRLLCRRDLLTAALLRSTERPGRLTPGVDGLAPIDLLDDDGLPRQKFVEELRLELQHDGSFRPHPLRPVVIRQGTKERELLIPTALDRVVHTALAMVLEGLIAHRTSDAVHGFRRERGVQTAVTRLATFVAAQPTNRAIIIVKLDLKACFDSIDHNLLINNLKQLITGNRLSRLVEMLIAAPVQRHRQRTVRRIGIPQGSPSSPVLLNLFLLDFDESIERRLAKFRSNGTDAMYVRYADDILIATTGTAKEASAIREFARRRLEKRKLTLNLKPGKSETHVLTQNTLDAPFIWLGFRIAREGNTLQLYIPDRAIDRPIERLKSLWGKAAQPGWTLTELATRWHQVRQGWQRHYKSCQNLREMSKALAQRTEEINRAGAARYDKARREKNTEEHQRSTKRIG